MQAIYIFTFSLALVITPELPLLELSDATENNVSICANVEDPSAATPSAIIVALQIDALGEQY